MFVAVGLVTSWVVDLTARRTHQAARASAEAELLRTTAGSILQGQGTLDALLERTREAFGMRSASLLERQDPEGGGARGPSTEWTVVACAGDHPVTRPDDADVDVPVTDTLALALAGPARCRPTTGGCSARSPPTPPSRSSSSGSPPRRRRPSRSPPPTGCGPRCSPRSATTCAPRSPRPRPRSPRCARRTSHWDAADTAELLATADESLDRLTHLVGNLLDMSRLQAGALSLFPRPSGLDEIVARSLDDLGPAGRDVTVDIPETLPAVSADPAILERIVVNLTENALRYSPAGKAPLLTASALGDRVELRVVDRGPGIPEEDRERMFVPFQRLGDTDNTTGVGLGLALARGLTEAMDGTLTAEDTPGGGLTMTISLPAAPGN